jgi:poly(glycerol-phosphate) alpha-glucosyltransferase
MNIAILTCSISRNAGGLLDAIRDLYKSMSENTKIVTIYSYKDVNSVNDLPSWGNMVIKLYKKKNPFFYSSKIKHDLLSSSTDILHIHGLWRYPHAFATIWKKTTNKVVLASPHGMLDPYIIKNQGFLKRHIGNLIFAKEAFKNIDCYHALCEAEFEAIRNYGINKPVAIIPNGVTLPTGVKKYQPTDDKKHLLFLGRLHPKKGVDMLIEAIAEIKKTTPQLLEGWVVDIVGWDQEGFTQKLKALVDKSDISEHIKFHGGLFGEAKEKMYATATAYILPSHGEGLPMTVLEAWSWGLPVIMTPQCNIPEGFKYNAAIKISNNKNSVKEGILTLLTMNPDKQKKMGSNGKHLVEKSFTWELSALKMQELYTWLNEGGKKPDFVK